MPKLVLELVSWILVQTSSVIVPPNTLLIRFVPTVEVTACVLKLSHP